MATKQKLPHYSLHHLIVSLSYLGSTTRILLIGFLALAVAFIRVLESQSVGALTVSESLLQEGQILVYTVGSFAILDIGYVLIARAYSFSKATDVMSLLGAEIVLATLYFLPYVALVPERFAYLSRWIFVASLFVLSLRLVTGLLFGKSIKK